MSDWRKLPPTLPTDGQTVWCRRFYLDSPFEATYDETEKVFVLETGEEIPFYIITRWKDRPA